MNWEEACRILGVSEAATEAEIKEQYVYKAQLLHPDKNQDKPEYIRKKAEAELSLVNQAYSFVLNHNNNPYRYPPKLALDPPGIRFKDVGIGQRKTTTFTVRNEGGPYTSIWIENQPAPWLTVTGVRSITAERLPLEVALECTGTGEPGRQYICDLPIRLENENTRSVDQATVKVELCTKSELEASAILQDLKSTAPPPTAPPRQAAPQPQSETEHAQSQPVEQAVPTNKFGINKSGFNIGAFVVDILAFALIGIAAIITSSIFVVISQTAYFLGLSLYSIIAFSVSIIHGFAASSKNP